jgi:parvulin-like peptidyl-prolyl isomerase
MSVKKATATVLALIMSVMLCSAVFAADKDNPTVLTVGTTQMSSDEVMRLIASTAGGNEMMASLMLAQSTVKERRDLVNQMGDAIVFAEAAKTQGLDGRPDVAFQIKWQTIQILLQAYMNEASSKWDMSDKATEKYYEEHKHEFVQAAAAKTSHILTDSEGDALDVIMELYKTKDFAKVAAEYSRDPNSAQNGGDLGWVEKGMMTASFDKAVEDAVVGQIMPPVQSEYGWHIIKVEKRRPSRQLSYGEAYQEVVQRLQRYYIEEELKMLRATYKIKVNEEALDNIGGIPAAPEKSE